MDTLDAHCGEIVTYEKYNPVKRMSSLTCLADFLARPESMDDETDYGEIRDSVIPPSNPSLDSSESPLSLTTGGVPKADCSPPHQPQRLASPHQPPRRLTARFGKDLLINKECEFIGKTEDFRAPPRIPHREKSQVAVNPASSPGINSALPSQPRRRGTIKLSKELLTITDVANESDSKKIVI